MQKTCHILHRRQAMLFEHKGNYKCYTGTDRDPTSSRIMTISANGLIYKDLHGNQCNNFYIPNFLDFLWNSNVRKRYYSQILLEISVLPIG